MILSQFTSWIVVQQVQQLNTLRGNIFTLYILTINSFSCSLLKILFFRIRLPTVLFRRLQQGSLALSNVSPRLSDSSINVVIIPGNFVAVPLDTCISGENGNDAATSTALVKSLRKEGYHFAVLEGELYILLW